MARDYAKKNQSSKKRRTSDKRTRSKTKKNEGNGIRLYFAGVLSGVFLSFIVYLALMDNDKAATDSLSTSSTASQQQEPEPQKPRFDFYKLLPEQTIDVEVEPAQDVNTPPPAGRDVYVLQAGSFRQREDADRRRAELLLLSLEPTVEETSGDNGRWFRVYLGPFESRSAMARARSLTANQDIDTLLLKRELSR